jgi:hypothetical protein
MDRDDAGTPDRGEQARQGDAGMIGSESEEPGPGRDTSLTEPDPVAASAEQPQTTVAMSEGDPMATRLGSHVEGAGVIGYDVAATEEGATQATRADDRPGYEPERSGYEPERPVGDAPLTTAPVAATVPLADERDPDLAAEPVVDQDAYEQGTDEQASHAQEPGMVAEPVVDRGSYAPVEDAGPSDSAGYADEPVAHGPPAFATEDAGAPDRSAVAADPARFGAGDAMAAPEPEVQEGVYDQEADQARRRRPPDGR